MERFSDLGLSAPTLKTLADLSYEQPTPIQIQAIPHVLAGRDVLGIAQTGTGKTAAFGLPIIERLVENPVARVPLSPRVLILAPTRELVGQIAENLGDYAGRTRLSLTTVVGGVSIRPQIAAVRPGLDILVATPGRLLDLVDQRALKLDRIEILVLDEADQMLDLGFIHALRRIVRLVPVKRQTLLFSATMPKLIAELAAQYLRDPVRVEVAPSGRPIERIEQSVHFVPQNEKSALLRRILGDQAHTLVFARTKRGADKLARDLDQAGFSVAAIHGNKSQGQRDRALGAFREQKVNVLVATDVAARGIDVPGVSHVVNYDLPNVPESYVHRIGRTARAGASGIAVSLCSPDERSLLRDIEKLTGQAIPVAGGGPRPANVGAAASGRPAAPQARRAAGSAPAGASEGERQQRRNRRPAASAPAAARPARNAGGLRRSSESFADR